MIFTSLFVRLGPVKVEIAPHRPEPADVQKSHRVSGRRRLRVHDLPHGRGTRRVQVADKGRHGLALLSLPPSERKALGRVACKNISHGFGIPFVRHWLTAPGVSWQRRATSPVPPAASMILFESIPLS